MALGNFLCSNRFFVMEIVKYGDPVLRRKGRKIDSVTDEIKSIIKDMFVSLDEAQGVGLAAQQVGLELQLCVIDVRPSDRPSWMEMKGEKVDPNLHMPMALINPVITPEENVFETGGEGCLSFPEIFADIKRSGIINVEAIDANGEKLAFRCGGLLAKAIQHEYDHLQGILFIDRMGFTDRENCEEDLYKLRHRTKEQIKRKKRRLF